MLTKEDFLKILNSVKDPELGHGVTDLGLIYDVQEENGIVRVVYTLTSPACPLGAEIEQNIRETIKRLPNVKEVITELTFTPPWSFENMNEDLRKEFGFWS